MGSDQVWRPKYSPFLPNYFLDFINENDKIKRIAYSASFGVDNWEYTPDQTNYYSSLVKKFNAVSVREESAVKVYVCGSRATSAQPVVDEIISSGKMAVAQQLNVLDADAIKTIFGSIASENDGHIDILVNSAGGSARGKAKNVVDQNIDVFDEIININLRGAMICSKEAAKYMIKNQSGRIINITSVIGVQGKAGFSEYAASKGGSVAFLKSLAQELGRYRITVNGVAPGIVQRGEVKMESIEKLRKTNWMGTYGKPEDIAAVVNFLCKEEASFITGQNIAADGGRSLGLKEN